MFITFFVVYLNIINEGDSLGVAGFEPRKNWMSPYYNSEPSLIL